MLMRILGVAALLFLVRIAVAQVPSDQQIREILSDAVDIQKRSVGISVGVIDASGRRVISHGTVTEGGTPVDGDTIFEIGSITKVFTVLLLAEMVEQGELQFDDPVVKYLPQTVTFPDAITLEHLATHRSGLPRLPANLSPADALNPYQDYSVDKMFEFLSAFRPTREPGERFEYSNIGGGLLGYVLARRANVDYETLIQTRICEPLGMPSTAITLSDGLAARLSPGHNKDLKVVPNWDMPTLAGAGALRSSVNDMLTFLGASTGLVDSSLAPAMRALTEVRYETDSPGVEMARGWLVFSGENELIFHIGGTGGYRTFVGYSVTSRVGVVVLSNSSASIDDIGPHLLDPRRALAKD